MVVVVVVVRESHQTLAQGALVKAPYPSKAFVLAVSVVVVVAAAACVVVVVVVAIVAAAVIVVGKTRMTSSIPPIAGHLPRH